MFQSYNVSIVMVSFRISYRSFKTKYSKGFSRESLLVLFWKRVRKLEVFFKRPNSLWWLLKYVCCNIFVHQKVWLKKDGKSKFTFSLLFPWQRLIRVHTSTSSRVLNPIIFLHFPYKALWRKQLVNNIKGNNFGSQVAFILVHLLS